MITDKERREVAKRLREISYKPGWSLGDWWLRVHGAVVGSEHCLCPQEDVAVIADLIDRPSIKSEKVGPVYWRCPRCGKINYKFVILGDCGPLPSHNCAYCGAVIADD